MDYRLEVKNRINRLLWKSKWRSSPYGSFPTKGGDGGDDLLWLGLLSSVKIPDAKVAILNSQGVNGMFFRNPMRRSNNNAGYNHFFSRDMAHGPLLLFAADRTLINPFASAWLNYIVKSRPCIRKKPKWLGGGCWLRGLYRYAPDDRSDITPTMWAIMGRVWKHNNWPLHSEMK